MLGKPMELPPDVARRFYKDLRAFLAEKNAIKADAIRAAAIHSYIISSSSRRRHRRWSPWPASARPW
jgi:hypothetical protein